MSTTMKCTTCGVELLSDENFVKFQCPNCLKVTIYRCSRCKRLSNEYVCSECGFTGP